MSDPTTPEGRAELRRIATDGWMIRPHQVLALFDALDQAEMELRHTRNNLDQARYGRTQADLAITRVRAVLDDWTPSRGSAAVFVDEIRAALDGTS